MYLKNKIKPSCKAIILQLKINKFSEKNPNRVYQITDCLERIYDFPLAYNYIS